MRRWQFHGVISSLSTIHTRVLSRFELTHLLQLCSNSKALDQAKQVHQQIIVHDLGPDPFATTKLIQVYAECNDIASARLLFDELPKPNVFAWTALIAFYSHNDMFSKCVKTFGEMKFVGVFPDEYVFPKVLRACAQSSNLKLGFLVHKDVIVYGAESNVHVCNSLIDMYSKCWDVESARRVFDATEEKDLLSWNSMIYGYVCTESYSMAVELFNFMRFNDFEPDIVTWNTIVDAYCRMGQCDEACKIFKQIKEPNIISWTTLIRGYLRMGKHEETIGIFRDMINRGKVFPDLGCLSSVLVSCRQLGFLIYGREIHACGLKFEARDIFCKSAGPALITMYARCMRIHDARNVFYLMDKSDVVAWNAMIHGFAVLGMAHSALECFRNMQVNGVPNNQTTLSSILPVCDLKSGEQIHAHVRKSSFSLAVLVCNALIHMYSKCGYISAAYSVFCRMVSRDSVSWNTIIGGFGAHGLGKAALHLLQEMNDAGFCPNPSTFTSVLSACSHSGLLIEGLNLFHRMTREFGSNIGIQHFACVVDLLTRAGQLEDAVGFINRMHLQPDKHIWGAVLAASLAHQNIRIAMLASENLVRLEPENAGHYVSLSNIYARAGRADDATKVRKLMESRAFPKPSAYSWITS